MRVRELIEIAQNRLACQDGIAWARTLNPDDIPPPASDGAGVRAWLDWAAERGGGTWAGWYVGRIWPLTSNLCCADLGGADLRCARLGDTDLCGANLRSSNLSGADLRCANLRGASLRGAYLLNADLSGADLSDAQFSGADLDVVIW